MKIDWQPFYYDGLKVYQDENCQGISRNSKAYLLKRILTKII